MRVLAFDGSNRLLELRKHDEIVKKKRKIFEIRAHSIGANKNFTSKSTIHLWLFETMIGIFIVFSGCEKNLLQKCRNIFRKINCFFKLK